MYLWVLCKDNLLGPKTDPRGTPNRINQKLWSLSTDCQALPPQRGDNIHLMKATLDVYTHIFSKLLQQSHYGGLLDHLPGSKKSRVHSDLTELQRKLKEVKTRLSPPNYNKEKALSKLNTIQVTFLLFLCCSLYFSR